MERRGFLGLLVSSTAAGALARRPAACERIQPLGVQLYTVRAAMRESMERTLERVAAIGFREVEFAGYFARTPRQVADALRAAGLAAPSAHYALEELEADAGARTLEAAAAIGHRYVVVPWIAPRDRETLDGWGRIAERLNRVGAAARAVGLRFAYHNHDFEFRRIDGRIPFDVLCESTDPDLVRIELDLFWITNGGADPLAFFQRWPGRTHLVHVKDRTAEGRMVDVGSGAIDWRAIFAQRAQAGIRHFFVEHDSPADPFASISASYRYLSRLDV